MKLIVKNMLNELEQQNVSHLKKQCQTLTGDEYKLDINLFLEITEKVRRLLYWDEDQLIAYAALCSYDPKELEMTMIADDNRIASTMYEVIWTFAKKDDKASFWPIAPEDLGETFILKDESELIGRIRLEKNKEHVLITT